LVKGDVELLGVEFEEASIERASLAVVGRGGGQEAIITAKIDVVAKVGETFGEREVDIQTKRKKQNKINEHLGNTRIKRHDLTLRLDLFGWTVLFSQRKYSDRILCGLCTASGPSRDIHVGRALGEVGGFSSF
jgi:hypothetical protein